MFVEITHTLSDGTPETVIFNKKMVKSVKPMLDISGCQVCMDKGAYLYFPHITVGEMGRILYNTDRLQRITVKSQ